MSLTNEERQTLVRRELEKAHEAYEEQDIVDGISIAADFIKAIEQLISEKNNNC